MGKHQVSEKLVIFCAPLVSKTTLGGVIWRTQMTCEQMNCERWPDVRENLQSDGFITRIQNECINFMLSRELTSRMIVVFCQDSSKINTNDHSGEQQN